MRAETYTKAVLTVIAFMVTMIAVKTVVSMSGASPKEAVNANGGTGAAVVPAATMPATAHFVLPVSPSPKAPEAKRGRSAVASSSSIAGGSRPPAEPPNCAIPEKDNQGCAVPVMRPDQAVQVIEHDLDNVQRGLAKTLHPGPNPPDMRTYEQRMQDELERIKNLPENAAAPRPGPITVTPDVAVQPAAPPKKQ